MENVLAFSFVIKITSKPDLSLLSKFKLRNLTWTYDYGDLLLKKEH